ncbi:MAG: YIP1 family protein [Gemmatimonadales bacterium]
MTSTAVDRPPSVWEDLLELFYAPRAVFERRRETPAFGLALIILVAAILLLTFVFKGVMEPVFEAEFHRGTVQAMKQNPQLTPEMMEQGKQFWQKFMVVIIGFTMLIMPLVLGLVLWVVGKLVESKAALGQAMMVATYAMFPRVLEGIINAIQMLALPLDNIDSRFRVTIGIGRLLDPVSTNPLVYALLTRVDLFTLWVTLLLGIGIAVMGKLSRERAILVAVVMWIVGAIPAVWGAVKAM